MATYLGPLTTTFTPPASCLATSVWYRAYNTAAVKLLDDANCFPESYVTNGYYSPGTICPSGYRGYAENDGAETSINCCPSGFQFSGPWPGVCSTLETVLTISVYVTGDPTQATSTQYYPPSAALWASAVQVRYRSADTVATTPVATATPQSSIAETSGATASTSDVTGPTDAASTATATSQPSSSASASSSLSTGAKIAIGVAIPIAAIIVLGLLLMIWRRRNRHRKGTGAVTVQELPSQETYKYEKNLSEVQGSFVRPQQSVAELDGSPK